MPETVTWVARDTSPVRSGTLMHPSRAVSGTEAATTTGSKSTNVAVTGPRQPVAGDIDDKGPEIHPDLGRSQGRHSPERLSWCRPDPPASDRASSSMAPTG